MDVILKRGIIMKKEYKDFSQYVNTIAGSSRVYDFEKIYRIFKERLMSELLDEQFISSATQDNIKKLGDLYGK